MIFSLLIGSIITTSPADLVIENARIWSNDRATFATFAAIDDGRFVHVGAPDQAWLGPQTRRIDAEGRTVLPGLIDAHVHMLGGGLNLAQLPLRDVADRGEFIGRIREWAATLPDGAWVRGGRWSTESWPDPTQPTREWIDAAAGNHPVYLPRMDGHSALVNSAALALAGINKDTPPDPEGGRIDRDPTSGEPTGILRESAMGLVGALVPEPSRQEKLDALALAMREANRNGITAVGDIPGLSDLEVYDALARSDVTVRFYLYPTAANWADAAREQASFTGRPHWVQVNGLKTYLDGSLGSRTAYMREPFHCNPAGEEDWHGMLREGITGGRLARNLQAAHDAGLQTIAHAIGDEANHLLLDTLETIYPDLADARCRSEHAQHLLPGDIPRFGSLGVIASMQPYHKADDGRYAENCIGSERAKWSYAYKSLLDAGAVVAFGSDWPVVTINPFVGIEAAVTGRILDGNTWQTQENITVVEALRCYTDRAAFSVFAEDEIGRIAPGYRADFIILSDSPFGGDVDWGGIMVEATYVEGRCVWERP